MVKRPPHILITTPESLYILLTSRRFRPALAHARFVIVDEIHALMGSKRGSHLAVTLERLQALVEAEGGPRPQRIGCSATVRPVEDALAFLTGSTARETTIVDAGFTRDLDLQVIAPVADFLHATSDTIWDATLQQVAELVEAHRTTLVFAQSRRAAERLARDLNDRLADGRVVRIACSNDPEPLTSTPPAKSCRASSPTSRPCSITALLEAPGSAANSGSCT